MGFNFRKSFKIAPGVKLNVTKNGISSVSVGKNGARVNVGKKGLKPQSVYLVQDYHILNLIVTIRIILHHFHNSKVKSKIL